MLVSTAVTQNEQLARSQHAIFPVILCLSQNFHNDSMTFFAKQ